MSEVMKTFSETGDFEASRAAEKWCHQNGISIGIPQRGAPRGLMYGDCAISKWRNLGIHEKAAMHGTLTGDMRNGPVFLRIAERSK